MSANAQVSLTFFVKQKQSALSEKKRNLSQLVTLK